MNRIRLDNKDFYYQVFYKRIKNMYLRITVDNQLVITCNKSISQARIEALIIKNQERIIQKIAETDNRVPLYEDMKFLLFGQELELTSNFNTKRNTYHIEGGRISVDFKKATMDYGYIERIYGDILLSKVKEVLKTKYNDIATYFQTDSVTFKTQLMKSRFGSCLPQKRIIKLNTILGRFPVFNLEAILVHELAHLKVPNHQKDFYELVDKLVPNYKLIRKDLHKLSRKYVI